MPGISKTTQGLLNQRRAQSIMDNIGSIEIYLRGRPGREDLPLAISHWQSEVRINKSWNSIQEAPVDTASSFFARMRKNDGQDVEKPISYEIIEQMTKREISQIIPEARHFNRALVANQSKVVKAQ